MAGDQAGAGQTRAYHRMGSPKYGGCVSGFLHFFDWNPAKRFSSAKRLPASKPETAMQPSRSELEAKTRMLQSSDAQLAPEEDTAHAAEAIHHREDHGRAPGVVARLMGLESLPQTPQPSQLHRRCQSCSSAIDTPVVLHDLLKRDFRSGRRRTLRDRIPGLAKRAQPSEIRSVERVAVILSDILNLNPQRTTPLMPSKLHTPRDSPLMSLEGIKHHVSELTLQQAPGWPFAGHHMMSTERIGSLSPYHHEASVQGFKTSDSIGSLKPRASSTISDLGESAITTKASAAELRLSPRFTSSTAQMDVNLSKTLAPSHGKPAPLDGFKVRRPQDHRTTPVVSGSRVFPSAASSDDLSGSVPVVRFGDSQEMESAAFCKHRVPRVLVTGTPAPEDFATDADMKHARARSNVEEVVFPEMEASSSLCDEEQQGSDDSLSRSIERMFGQGFVRDQEEVLSSPLNCERTCSDGPSISSDVDDERDAWSSCASYDPADCDSPKTFELPDTDMDYDLPEQKSPAGESTVDQPSPVSILNSPFHDETCTTSETDGCNDTGAKIRQALLDISTFQSLEAFTFDYKERISSVSSPEEEEAFIREILTAADFLSSAPESSSPTWFNHDLAMDPSLFDRLELAYEASPANLFQVSGGLWRCDRRLLFDCVNEAFGVVVWRSQTMGVLQLQQPKGGQLVEEVYRKVKEWRKMGECDVEGLIERDVCVDNGRWKDFSVEVVEVGMNVEGMVWNAIVEEAVVDLLATAKHSRDCCASSTL